MTSISQRSPASCGTSQCATSEPITHQPAVGPVHAGRAAGIRTLLRSDEFTCPSCVAKIEKQVRHLPGVYAATVHFATGRIDVEYDPQVLTVEDLVVAVAKAGYRARPAAW